MSKLIDVDKLFSNFAPQFIATNYANCEPDEIEEKIDEIYYHFGNTKLSELGENPPPDTEENEVQIALKNSIPFSLSKIISKIVIPK